MSGLLLLLMVLQVFNGLMSMVAISYGVLAAEAIRIVIYAGLLWGAGDLADLCVKSHCDLRAIRVLLGRTSPDGQGPARRRDVSH
jgi:diphthamide synthase subunit DPH2